MLTLPTTTTTTHRPNPPRSTLSYRPLPIRLRVSPARTTTTSRSRSSKSPSISSRHRPPYPLQSRSARRPIDVFEANNSGPCIRVRPPIWVKNERTFAQARPPAASVHLFLEDPSLLVLFVFFLRQLAPIRPTLARHVGQVTAARDRLAQPIKLPHRAHPAHRQRPTPGTGLTSLVGICAPFPPSPPNTALFVSTMSVADGGVPVG